MRGTNVKDIWGPPHLRGKERGHADSATELLLRMHELMKLCESSGVPLYIENPQASKLWMHPIIKKWVRHPSSHLVAFDYCQYGTEWKKPTTILSFGNTNFHTGKSVRCKGSFRDGISYCSKTGKPHVTLSGFVNGAQKGQYKTNRACPYPVEFCDYVSDFIYKPNVKITTRSYKGGNQGDSDTSTTVSAVASAMPVGPAVSMNAPPADHYLTHLPKHPGCKACMNCKVQRKHCRDLEKGRKKKMVSTTDIDEPLLPHEIEEKLDAQGFR